MKDKLRNRWPLLFAIILTGFFISYSFYARCLYPANKAVYIESYGIICIALILFLSFYVLRKNSFSYRLGTRESWLQAHVYTGIMSIIVLLMHIDFKPTGTFGIFLFIIFVLVITSGILGSLIYSYVPLSLTKYGRTLKSDEEIASSIAGCLKEADKLVSSTSEELKKLYETKIRPFIKQGKIRWTYLLMTERELLETRRDVIEQCRAAVPGQDMSDLNILSSILIEKEKLSFMQAKLQLQKAWLNVHMPLTLALLTGTVIHVLTVIYY